MPKNSSVSQYIKDAIRLNGRDIFFVSYPKSGSTWLRFLLWNSNLGSDEIEYSHKKLNQFMPVIGTSIRQGILFNQKRIIKTHRLLPLFANDGFTIIREPSQVLTSYFNHLHSFSSTDDKFIDFARGKNGINWLTDHLKFYKKKQYMILEYSEFVNNPMKALNILNDHYDFGLESDQIEFVLSNYNRVNQAKQERAEGLVNRDSKAFSESKGVSVKDSIEQLQSCCSDEFDQVNTIYQELVSNASH